MLKQPFFKFILAIFLVVCHFSAFVCAQETETVQVSCCAPKNDVQENECTYIEKTVENEIIEQENQTDESNLFSSIKQGIIDSHSIIYICVIPLSILTAPIAMIVAWGTIFYTVYHNDELVVFR